ncbi:MAG: response regulator transcription factor [Brumimicrobium sp.]|nr:response regulator transcription factor [Brumimicrobium sp.]
MRFLIADDHPIFRSGLKSLLLSYFPYSEIVEKNDGREAEKYILEHQPDYAILDIDMPGKNGLEICLSANAATTTKVIILTMYKDADMLRKAMDNGADAYLVKDNTSDELVECIETLILGKKYWAKSLKSPEIQSELKEYREVAGKLSLLTETELKTLKLVGKKYSSKEIAELLFVSVKSVENYRSRICKKLELDAKNNSLLIWVLDNKSVLEEF